MGRTTDASQVSWMTSLMKVFAPTGTRTPAVRGGVVTNQQFRPLDHKNPHMNSYINWAHIYNKTQLTDEINWQHNMHLVHAHYNQYKLFVTI